MNDLIRNCIIAAILGAVVGIFLGLNSCSTGMMYPTGTVKCNPLNRDSYDYLGIEGNAEVALYAQTETTMTLFPVDLEPIQGEPYFMTTIPLVRQITLIGEKVPKNKCSFTQTGTIEE